LAEIVYCRIVVRPLPFLGDLDPYDAGLEHPQPGCPLVSIRRRDPIQRRGQSLQLVGRQCGALKARTTSPATRRGACARKGGTRSHHSSPGHSCRRDVSAGRCHRLPPATTREASSRKPSCVPPCPAAPRRRDGKQGGAPALLASMRPGLRGSVKAGSTQSRDSAEDINPEPPMQVP
jgi:hypothetical protein